MIHFRPFSSAPHRIDYQRKEDAVAIHEAWELAQQGPHDSSTSVAIHEAYEFAQQGPHGSSTNLLFSREKKEHDSLYTSPPLP